MTRGSEYPWIIICDSGIGIPGVGDTWIVDRKTEPLILTIPQKIRIDHLRITNHVNYKDCQRETIIGRDFPCVKD